MKYFKNNKPVIAIDGTAGSGKGTLAKNLSQKLKFDHLDTGLLYRIYAYETENKKRQIQLNDFNKWFEGSLSTEKLRTEKISKIASQISQKSDVRQFLVQIQRNFANNPPQGKGSVIDGRDIGSVIIPEAEIKFFVDAKIEIRAMRRLMQLKFEASEFESTLVNMRERDEQDINRKISPLKKSSDSFLLDTSHLNEKEVCDSALQYIKNNTDFI